MNSKELDLVLDASCHIASNAPTPAAARYCRAGQPSPPAPTTTTEDRCKFNCPRNESKDQDGLEVRCKLGHTGETKTIQYHLSAIPSVIVEVQLLHVCEVIKRRSSTLGQFWDGCGSSASPIELSKHGRRIHPTQCRGCCHVLAIECSR